MNYRSADYRANPDEIDKGTTFPTLVPRFRLNKASCLLEKDEPLDITKLVNSSRNVELKSLLSALEAGTAELTTQVKSQYEDYSDTLDRLSNGLDFAEECRERFGMGSNVSVEEIIKRVDIERDKLKQSLDLLQKQQVQPEQKSNVEVTGNASQNFEKTE